MRRKEKEKEGEAVEAIERKTSGGVLIEGRKREPCDD